MSRPSCRRANRMVGLKLRRLYGTLVRRPRHFARQKIVDFRAKPVSRCCPADYPKGVGEKLLTYGGRDQGITFTTDWASCRFGSGKTEKALGSIRGEVWASSFDLNNRSSSMAELQLQPPFRPIDPSRRWQIRDFAVLG
jgi:hypothetical protein